jgi:hypothetical protein
MAALYLHHPDQVLTCFVARRRCLSMFPLTCTTRRLTNWPRCLSAEDPDSEAEHFCHRPGRRGKVTAGCRQRRLRNCRSGPNQRRKRGGYRAADRGHNSRNRPHTAAVDLTISGSWSATSNLEIRSSFRSNATESCNISHSRWNDFRIPCRPLRGQLPSPRCSLPPPRLTPSRKIAIDKAGVRQDTDISTPVRRRQDSLLDVPPQELFVHNVYSVRVWHLECLMTFVAVGQ